MVVFKEDLRWIGALFFMGGVVLLSLSVFGLVAPEDRHYPALSSVFVFFAATGFMGYRRVEIEPADSIVTELKSSWRFWNPNVRKVPFSQCQGLIVGGPVKPNKGLPFRRVWLELQEGEPILLTTIARGGLPVAREAAQRAATALELEIQETRRKFPGD